MSKLPKQVKPDDPTQSRFAVLTVVLESQSDGWIDVDLGDFVLEYELAGAKASMSCAGINLSADYWSFDQKGVLVHMKPSRAAKLAFVLPKSVGQVAARCQ